MAKASASGPTLDYTNPANAKKIWDFLNAQSKSVNTYATNPLWQVVYGPYKLTAFNATTGSFTMAPNATYSGPHANPMSTFVGVPFTSDAATFNAIKSGSVDVVALPSADNPQIPSLKSYGYNYYGLPAWGDYFAAYNFKDTTGDFNNIANQLYFRQAMQHLEDQEGQIKAFLNGDGDPLSGPIGAYPQSPFLPANGKTTLYPFSISAATSPAEVERLDRHPERDRHLREGGHGHRSVRGRHPGWHQAGLQPDLQRRLADHPGSRGPGLQREGRPASTSRCRPATSTS